MISAYTDLYYESFLRSDENWEITTILTTLQVKESQTNTPNARKASEQNISIKTSMSVSAKLPKQRVVIFTGIPLAKKRKRNLLTNYIRL